MKVRIGVVIHGPGIVDRGYVERVLEVLREFPGVVEISAKVGGNMGRVAVIDRGLEGIVDISERLYPSQCLRRLRDRDILLLLNYGKSRETGHTFGRIVVERAGIDKPVIQIERPGEDDGSILVWNREVCSEDVKEILEALLSHISKRLGLEVMKCTGNKLSVWEEGDRVFRRIDTVDPGESILVNGVVVGRALGSPVVLIAERGRIVKILQGEIKRDGVERLGTVDLRKAIVKTGILRKSPSRIIGKRRIGRGDSPGEVVVVDRGDIDIVGMLRDRSISTLVTVGSDTTSILGSVLSRFNVKIIGIVDEDFERYKLLEDARIGEGSLILLKNCECHQVGNLLEHLKGRRLSYEETLEYVIGLLEKNGVVYEINK